jgi:GntR family transcriptional regulator
MDRIAVRRDLGSPLHHQIYLVLADGISTGRYGEGEALPTEEQLTRMFGVSRITVRRAMESLNDAGLIERGAGRRTVVRAQLGRPMRMTMNSVIENIVAYGSETDARVVEFGYVEARGVVRERLWQATERPVQRAVRVRSHEGTPIMHLTSYVPSTLGETFTADDLNRIPMFQLLARAGAHLARGDQVVSATLADPTVASRLDVKVGAALIDMRRMMFDQKGRAVEYIEMLAVPDRMALRMELGSGQVAPRSGTIAAKPSRVKKHR